MNDYSNCTFTYTGNYHFITNGTNELAAKLSCLSSPTNLTKWNSVNVTGIEYFEQSKSDANHMMNRTNNSFIGIFRSYMISHISTS